MGQRFGLAPKKDGTLMKRSKPDRQRPIWSLNSRYPRRIPRGTRLCLQQPTIYYPNSCTYSVARIHHPHDKNVKKEENKEKESNFEEVRPMYHYQSYSCILVSLYCTRHTILIEY